MKRLSISGNVIFGFLGWALPLGISFVLTPVIVRSLGVEAYGLYGLVITFAGYFASLNFNVGRSVIRYVASQDSRNQVRRISEIISSAALLYIVIGIASAVALAAMARWLVVSILEVSPALQEIAIGALRITSVGLVFTMVGQVLMAVAQGLQRFDVSAGISVISGGALIIGSGILAYSGFGVISLIAWNLAVSILSFCAYVAAVRYLLPGFKPMWFVDRTILRSLLKFSGAVTAYQIFGNILVLFERGYINRSLGTAAVTYYIIPMTIATYLHSMIGSMALIIFPMASEAEAKGDATRLYTIYTRSLKLICFVVGFLGLTLCLGSEQFMSNWMGRDFAVHTVDLLAIQVVVFGLVAMMIVPWQVADGVDFPWLNAILSFFWLVSGSILGIILTGRIGLSGFAWARLISMAILPLYVYWLERRAFGRCLIRFWFGIVWRLVLAGGIVAAAEIGLFYIMPAGWLGFIGCLVVSGVLYTVLLWRFGYLEIDERKWALGLLFRIGGSRTC